MADAFVSMVKISGKSKIINLSSIQSIEESPGGFIVNYTDGTGEEFKQSFDLVNQWFENYMTNWSSK